MGGFTQGWLQAITWAKKYFQLSFCPALISFVEPPVELSFIVKLLIDVDLEEGGITSAPSRGTEFSKMVYISFFKKITFELSFGHFLVY